MNNQAQSMTTELETLVNEYQAYINERKAQRIEVQMVAKDVFRIDMTSLRKSKKVQAQLEAARKSFERGRHNNQEQFTAELCEQN